MARSRAHASSDRAGMPRADVAWPHRRPSAAPSVRRAVPCGTSARASWSLSRPVGRWSGRVCGGHLPSTACPAPAGATRKVHDHLVAWVKPQTGPSWLPGRPSPPGRDSCGLRAGRCRSARRGSGPARAPWSPRGSTQRGLRLSALAALSRQCWQVETARPQLETPRPMDGLHGKPAGRRAARTDDVGHRLPPGAPGHGAIGDPPPPRRGAEQMSSRPCGGAARPVPACHDLAVLVNPVRPPRVEPRVKKRRPKSFR